MANDIYTYKRYQLSLKEDDEMQKRIIDYLDSFRPGKQRNNALVKLLINAMNGTADINIPSQTSDMLTEIRLNKLENMIKSLMASNNNSATTHCVHETSANVPEEEDTTKSLAEDNQVPGQMLFDSVDMKIKEENTVSTVGSNADKGELVPTKEDITKENGVIKEMVANSLIMPSPSAIDEAKEGIEDDISFDDIVVDDDIIDFMKQLNGDT